MKTIATVLFLVITLGLHAQEKFSAGVGIEGFNSSPKNLFTPYAHIKQSLGTGAGIYFSATVWKSFSANTGLNYRFVSFDCSRDFYSGNQLVSTDQFSYKQNTLVVPVNIRKNINKWLFAETGIELNWILNREVKKPQNEILWKIGLGSKIGRLNYSLNYLWETQEQSDVINYGPAEEYKFAAVKYKNRMLQFTVTYPIWVKKQKNSVQP